MFEYEQIAINLNPMIHSSFCLFYFYFSARSQSSLSQASPALQGSHNASTATKELDDLMASLSDFKVSWN